MRQAQCLSTLPTWISSKALFLNLLLLTSKKKAFKFKDGGNDSYHNYLKKSWNVLGILLITFPLT